MVSLSLIIVPKRHHITFQEGLWYGQQLCFAAYTSYAYYLRWTITF